MMLDSRKPALMGGDPVFKNRLGIVSPCLPTLEQIEEPLREILSTGNLTNNSKYVQQFELQFRDYLGIPYAVAVSNATLGLILALKALNIQGEVILPSFTYCATAHSLMWSGLTPVFVDVLPDTFTLDPEKVEAIISSKTAAILAVHIFGHPCEITELSAIAEKYHIPLLFDAAHAIGSSYNNIRIGRFGTMEVFSFHATKVFPVGEGGCITTEQVDMANYLKIARKFGDPGDENTLFPGTNAKMQEFNAILGLSALHTLDLHIANRRKYAQYLLERLGRIPGITFQSVRPYVFTNYQNFAILIDPVQFGMSRDNLFDALIPENIVPRKYFYPPLHHHETYLQYRSASLPVTEDISSRVLCLPFYSEMTDAMLDGLCTAIECIHGCSPNIRGRLEH